MGGMVGDGNEGDDRCQIMCSAGFIHYLIESDNAVGPALFLYPLYRCGM